MIKIENYEVVGWGHAIRGMRNPMNSWERSDSKTINTTLKTEEVAPGINRTYWDTCEPYFAVGENDLELMMKLATAGPVHGKFRRMIAVYVDVTAPLYWWKEYDTYKVGTVANSCSTMHKIHEKEFTMDDFSCEHLIGIFVPGLQNTIRQLNIARNTYVHGGEVMDDNGDIFTVEPKDKRLWYQMIQLLPSSYNQKRTLMLNYEVLANIYQYRKNHKLDEWRTFCNWIENLPYSEIITGYLHEPGEESEEVSE